MKHLLLASLILLCACHSTISKKGQENDTDSIRQQENLYADSVSGSKTIHLDSLFMQTEYDYYPLSTTEVKII